MHLSSFYKALQYTLFSALLKIVLLAVILLFSTASYAQMPEGMVRYIRTADRSRELASSEYLSKELQAKFSEGYGLNSYFTTLYINATRTRFEGWDEQDPEWINLRSDYTIIRDFSKQIVQELHLVNDKKYLVVDSLRAPKWIILNEMKEIAGHTCMNAYCKDTLRHQKVIAWYALDIPLAGGPESFFGLPGLILEVNVNDGALLLTASKITPLKLTTELDLPKKTKGKKIKEKDYMDIISKQIAENRKKLKPLFNGVDY
jgi:GLPGLI family protein